MNASTTAVVVAMTLSPAGRSVRIQFRRAGSTTLEACSLSPDEVRNRDIRLDDVVILGTAPNGRPVIFRTVLEERRPEQEPYKAPSANTATIVAMTASSSGQRVRVQFRRTGSSRVEVCSMSSDEVRNRDVRVGDAVIIARAERSGLPEVLRVMLDMRRPFSENLPLEVGRNG